MTRSSKSEIYEKSAEFLCHLCEGHVSVYKGVWPFGEEIARPCPSHVSGGPGGLLTLFTFRKQRPHFIIKALAAFMNMTETAGLLKSGCVSWLALPQVIKYTCL